MGQQAFGKATLESYLDRGEDVVAVYCAPDKEGKPIDPVKEFALEKGLPVYQPANFKDADVLDEMRGLNADLCVMSFVIIFVPEEARDIPTHGSICFHPSLLPLHRGPSSINWPIIGGSTKSGLSIFWPNDGLDEGEILLQKEVDISPDDTLGSVYFDKIFPLGIAAMGEAVDMIRDGNLVKEVQDESKATYESWCKKSDAEIDWSKPVDEVYNLIRGTNPQPGAWTTINGAEVKIFDCEKSSETGGASGEVMSDNANGFTVAAPGGHILVKRVRPDGSGKIPASELVANGGVSKGDVLGQ
ncbi:MAG: methionyl-tRNA formyltransferase [Rhodospirillales bacterium]|nr:methionyl-tRNA formyltransferase [Rhodospirillales bacterium]MBT4039999.1 methionyl-tRNA formyltransferase [Rhodospirillales bacterium]MBT4625831.1 methionyl-tRNA formyltransferase [Rhodospirillales bacterium]MBT5351661.1 methionyl-tRNA formyltransferase [Rhodospirillales bacterium]MBT5521338.1 methionyl-tRNA formyltransferase [Rhodospirillales bacterium]